MGPSSITFQPEDFNSSLSVSKCVTVSILTDQAIEGDHYFDLVILSELSDPEITPGTLSTLTIQINDVTRKFALSIIVSYYIIRYSFYDMFMDMHE